MRMRGTFARMAVATALTATACYTTRSLTIDDLAAQRERRIWVTRADQSVVLVNDAQVFRGKVVGFVDGRYRELPPADVRALRVRRFAAGRTVSLFAAGALAFTVAALLLSGQEDAYDPCVGGPVDCNELAQFRH